MAAKRTTKATTPQEVASGKETAAVAVTGGKQPLKARTPSKSRPSAAAAALAGPPYAVLPGKQHPLGAVVDAGGVNFSVFAEEATSVELLLFDEHDSPEPIQTIVLDPNQNKTFHFWHCYVRGLRPGAHYAYRVDGPKDLHGKGHRYNRNKVLIDPYALGHTNALWNRVDACGPDDNVRTSMRSVVVDPSGFDWEGDRPLNRPMQETIIYELHVGGFTKSPTSGVRYPGTFLGLIEKIPYLKELGVTAVELLPVHDFDDLEVLRLSPIDGKPLKNYWGYSTISFFAPHNGYCVNPDIGCHLDEFREMVKALHKAGIEVILDVVYNHTSEGNHQGPTINFKGLANHVYYLLSTQDRQYYMDYTGCGNTVNGNHPITEKMIIESLEFWVKEMHVDGFRFDEAVILVRGEDGLPMVHPPVIWQIELSETLADTKIIAECWDAAGLYQVGYFPGYRWAEWNGKFRDAIRRFVRGDGGLVNEVAWRICGSADIFQTSGELPINSVNFVTCHDGFTLNDLVSYNVKHNEANGEHNRDGIDNNDSWNCGVEGETEDAVVESLRERQVRNFATILLLSQGVPMISMGDEVRRTQRGNNNAYCQDNEISWFDWTLVDKHRDLLRFWQRMIAFRKAHPILHRSRFFTGQVDKANRRGLADITWHGCQLNSPGWNDPECRVLAYTLGGTEEEPDLHVMLNMHWTGMAFELPVLPDRKWYRVVDTSLPSPEDIADPGQEVRIEGSEYFVNERSVVVLMSKP